MAMHRRALPAIMPSLPSLLNIRIRASAFWEYSIRTMPSAPMPSSRNWLPRLEVRMMMVFFKSTVRPWLSVIRPSSSTCRRILNTSGWAFSTSSNRMTE